MVEIHTLVFHTLFPHATHRLLFSSLLRTPRALSNHQPGPALEEQKAGLSNVLVQDMGALKYVPG